MCVYGYYYMLYKIDSKGENFLFTKIWQNSIRASVLKKSCKSWNKSDVVKSDIDISRN